MSKPAWYIADNGKSTGPFTEFDIATRLESGKLSPDMLAYGPGSSSWAPLKNLPAFARQAADDEVTPPPPAKPGLADEIDFQIFGQEMQFVEVELDPGESAVAEAGSMMYMRDAIDMTTVFGDGSQEQESKGFMGKLLGAGKRLITGESLFITVFTNNGRGKQHVAFAAPYAGHILPMDLSQCGEPHRPDFRVSRASARALRANPLYGQPTL